MAASGLKAEELIPPVPVIQALAEQNSAALVPRTREADHEGEACTNLSRNCTRPDGPASAPIRLEHIRGTNPRRSHPWITHREGEAYKRRSTFETEILSVRSGSMTRGHRFLCPGSLQLRHPDEYERVLLEQGYVVPDFAARKLRIERQVQKLAEHSCGTIRADDELIELVTGLVEWPTALVGEFDAGFLEMLA